MSIKMFWKKDKTKGKSQLRFSLICLLFIVYCLLSLWQCNPPITPDVEKREVVPRGGFDLIERNDEMFFSQKITSDIEREIELIQNNSLNDYLDQLAEKIISQSRYRDYAEGYDWTFKVFDSIYNNAFTSIGGKVFLSRSLVEFTENESELAGIIAFEIAHVMARNIHQHLSRELLVKNKVSPGGVITGENGLKSIYKAFGEGRDVMNFLPTYRFILKR